MNVCILLLSGLCCCLCAAHFRPYTNCILPVVETVVNVNAIASIAFSLGKTNILRRIHTFYFFTRFCFWPTIPVPIFICFVMCSGRVLNANSRWVGVLHLNLGGKFTECVSKCEQNTIDTNTHAEWRRRTRYKAAFVISRQKCKSAQNHYFYDT